MVEGHTLYVASTAKASIAADYAYGDPGMQDNESKTMEASLKIRPLTFLESFLCSVRILGPQERVLLM